MDQHLQRDLEEVINRHLSYPGQRFKISWGGETNSGNGQTEYNIHGTWIRDGSVDPTGEAQVPPRSDGDIYGFKSIDEVATEAGISLTRVPGVIF